MIARNQPIIAVDVLAKNMLADAEFCSEEFFTSFFSVAAPIFFDPADVLLVVLFATPDAVYDVGVRTARNEYAVSAFRSCRAAYIFTDAAPENDCERVVLLSNTGDVPHSKYPFVNIAPPLIAVALNCAPFAEMSDGALTMMIGSTFDVAVSDDPVVKLKMLPLTVPAFVRPIARK